MSGFSCDVVRVKIVPHPNADQIEIAMVGDYQSIVKKGQFNDGYLAVYIPEQSVLPEWLLKELGFWDDVKGKGTLSGGAGNRVRAVRLRGVVSQGIVYPTLAIGSDGAACTFFAENGQVLPALYGDDAASSLGITKYEPPIPSHMAGKILGVDLSATHKYDFDNLKKMPSLFDDGEDVVITEKIHGTLMCVGLVPAHMSNEKYYKGRVTLSSKGMGAKGQALDHSDESNLYAQAARKHDLLEKMLAMDVFMNEAQFSNKPVFIIGEVFGVTASGKGVQDLTYTDEELDFRVFDICVGNRGSELYLNNEEFTKVVLALGLKSVPVMYVGPYSKAKVLELTDGPTTMHKAKARGLEKPAHIREGVVVKSAVEDQHPHFGRKIAKSVSSDYLLRKNGTELN
jgi:RNA ligase (TIGR02306 family)